MSVVYLVNLAHRSEDGTVVVPIRAFLSRSAADDFSSAVSLAIEQIAAIVLDYAVTGRFRDYEKLLEVTAQFTQEVNAVYDELDQETGFVTRDRAEHRFNAGFLGDSDFLPEVEEVPLDKRP